MELGIEKRAMLVVEKEKTEKSVGIELLDCKVIRSLQEVESYRYFWILESDRILGKEMKLKVSKEYFRMLKNVLKSKLNGGKLVQGVNTWGQCPF